MYLKNNIYLILVFSLILKTVIVLIFHERSLTDEWLIIFKNFEISKTYSFYVFDGQHMPTSYMPPLYFIFLYLNKIIAGETINFLYLVYFFQLLLSTYSVFIFYKICKKFLDENYSLLGALIFSIFPIIIFSNALISSACLQLVLYLFFINIYLQILNNEYNLTNLLLLSFSSSLCLLLRGEFLIIFLFSILYLLFLNKKKTSQIFLILFLTILLVSPYLKRNYENFRKIHIVNVTGFALWKGNNQMEKVEGFHHSLHPEQRNTWPKIKEFKNLYENLDKIQKDKMFEINRDKVFKDEAIKNILSDKIKFLFLYFKKIFSYYFIDLNSSLKNYYNPLHIFPAIIFGFMSLPGVIISLKKAKNAKLIYLFLTMTILTLLISLFFILPRYKISILPIQLFFSLFFIQYLMEKYFKKKIKI